LLFFGFFLVVKCSSVKLLRNGFIIFKIRISNFSR
jgi:hypothetical protein